ncbi:MAG: hypothetical protein RIR00_800 [Pseudomonadota bacterium]
MSVAMPSELAELADIVRNTSAPLCPQGGNSKAFYGRPVAATPLSLAAYRGVIAYEPSELYLTARAGTPLVEIENLLAAQGQMLAWEPPAFPGATLGGSIASGLSGPRRQRAGAARDFVLGVTLVDGRGEVLLFGGQVMKNVAGYDVSRFLVGSLGTLGVLAEITVKVLPRPAAEATLVFDLTQAEALTRLAGWGRQPWPISASCWLEGRLLLRLSGARAAVDKAVACLGGSLWADAAGFWQSLRNQELPLFQQRPLWRLAVPVTTPALAWPERQALEWGGGLRWLAGDDWPAAEIRRVAQAAGGHATLYRADPDAPESEVFTPLAPALLALQQRLKQRFDPRGILSPGRIYEGL